MKIALPSGPDTLAAVHLETLIVAETLPAKELPGGPLVGYQLDERYKLEALIGEGSTGCVYRARQVTTGREVAVKLLRDDLLRDEVSVRRFQREAWAACRINHPNAIIVHDFGQSQQGHCYLVTELIEGETLRQHLDREGLLSPERALWIFHEILAGVAAAHEQGVVHRDLHPGNIFLCHGSHGEERIKVFDFGGARLLDSQQDTDVTGTGHLDLQQLLHSIRYLPPERLQRDQRPDPRGDVYALGLILFELCTGQYPFAAADPLQVMAKHLREAPPLLSAYARGRVFSPGLQGLVTSMLAKDPLLRPRDAGEVARRLRTAEERAMLITVNEAELLPEPEMEVEMEAMPADESDTETAPIPLVPAEPLSTSPAPLRAHSSDPATRLAHSAVPPLHTMAQDDTIREMEPMGMAPVRALPPELAPSLPGKPLPRPGGGLKAAMLALLCLLAGAGVVFAGGSLLYRLYLRAQVPPQPSSLLEREPPPAPLNAQ